MSTLIIFKRRDYFAEGMRSRDPSRRFSFRPTGGDGSRLLPIKQGRSPIHRSFSKQRLNRVYSVRARLYRRPAHRQTDRQDDNWTSTCRCARSSCRGHTLSLPLSFSFSRLHVNARTRCTHTLHAPRLAHRACVARLHGVQIWQPHRTAVYPAESP